MTREAGTRAGRSPRDLDADGADDPLEGHLEDLTERVVEMGDPDIVPLATALAVAGFRRRSSIDALAHDAPGLARLLVDAARVVAGRGPGEVALRVSQPDDGGGVVDVNADDGPFLVSTLTSELKRRGLETTDVIHPILGVERHDDGTIRRILPARHAAHRESWIHARLADHLDEDARARLQDALTHVLRQAKAVTGDFSALRERVMAMAREARDRGPLLVGDSAARDVADLLEWALDDHLVLLGAVDETLDDGALRPDPGTGLGLLAGADEPLAAPAGFGEDLLDVRRTRECSPVHRNEPMLRFGLVRVDADGAPVGRRRLDAMLSQKAFTQPSSAVPVLRGKLRRVLEAEDVVDHSHDERALRDLFDAIPKPDLLSASAETVRRTLVDLLASARTSSVRLVVRPGDSEVTALVTIPRDRFDADLRRRIQQLLVSTYGASSVEYHLALTEGDQALLHFSLLGGDATGVRIDEVQAQVVELARGWDERLREALGHAEGAGDPGLLARRWGRRLPDSYTAATDPAAAVGDVLALDGMVTAGDTLRVRVGELRGGHMRVTLMKRGAGIELSSVLPLLESTGLVVVEEVPHRVDLDAGDGGDRDEIHVHVVTVRGEGLADFDAATDSDRLARALLAIWTGDSQADSLNRLVLSARLEWGEVDVLRAYRRYRRQVGTSFTESYQNDALCEHPALSRALVDLFAARFDPDLDAEASDAAAEDARARIADGLEEVSRLDADRILRGYHGLIEATLRTNRYRTPRRGWLSMKLDSAAVPSVPLPVPYREIFVWSPETEGIHLRGGAVARGGLRWSDRLEDVRTEVLGLMKAQVIKNALIVPTGSKGGFVLKVPPTDPERLREEVRRQYEVFIRGLLDLTDDVVEGEVVAPHRVVRRDGDDPYLVVAADRGTATFSDAANAISEEYDFWLGDAFASGGSRGYDHKQMGITARGAWVAIRRHFLELDIDPLTEPVTVTGIGDMSGDVFGNGMLRSRHLRLVAAFDHRDVFVDPDPDPAVAYAERERLYHAARSTWQDYDRAAISSGGGVWSRTAKSIPLSDEMRGLLGVDQPRMSPPDLVRAILRTPVDLLFAGGIGTFVKAADESNDAVGDRANDAIRVNAGEVGARVIGEGGNLAVTQRGRIAYARRGGRVNLDAIDNAAGVATSDAEVNLKILLGQAIDAGELDGDGRDEVLAQVRDDVAEGVLEMVWRQAWAISREQSTSAASLEAYEQLLQDLEEAGHADRDVDVLPSSSELRRRREVGAGLTRPELGVLLGASKIDLSARLLASSLPEDPALRPLLVGAFPAPVATRFDHLLDRHRLRRELVATRLAGKVVDRLGITWVSRTAHERGCTAAEVAAGWWVAVQVTGAEEAWRRIDDLEGAVVPELQVEMASAVDGLVDACARAYVREMPVESIAELVRADREAFRALMTYVSTIPGTRRVLHAGRVSRWTNVGVDDDLAERLALLAELTLAPDVAAVARRLDLAVEVVADAFVQLTDALPLDDLHTRLEHVSTTGRWDRWHTRGLVDDLRDLRRQAAVAALSVRSDDGARAVDDWLAQRPTARGRVTTLIERLERDADAGLSAVAVVVAALRGMFD